MNYYYLLTTYHENQVPAGTHTAGINVPRDGRPKPMKTTFLNAHLRLMCGIAHLRVPLSCEKMRAIPVPVKLVP